MYCLHAYTYLVLQRPFVVASPGIDPFYRAPYGVTNPLEAAWRTAVTVDQVWISKRLCDWLVDLIMEWIRFFPYRHSSSTVRSVKICCCPWLGHRISAASFSRQSRQHHPADATSPRPPPTAALSVAIASPPQTSAGPPGIIVYRGGGGADVMLLPRAGDRQPDLMTNQLIIRQEVTKKGLSLGQWRA